MPANAFWNIIFGPYTFTVNRRELTYRLEETETGTLWADTLSLGTIEIIERATGIATHHSFGELKLLSLSEKSGATGKRILFGLDAPGGIPVDVYLTCTEREIQVTVEANRDTKTHRIGAITLLPGLCAVPDDGVSHLVLPHREGTILFAPDAPRERTSLRIWEAEYGLTMPFVGAVRIREGGRPGQTALALLTDSAYGIADLNRFEDNARLDLRYERDPERRRLDVRIVLIPGGDAVSIARAYRDKIIGDGGHVTLRKKIREKPALSAWLSGEESVPTVPKEFTLPADANRWLAMEEQAQEAREGGAKDVLIFADLGGDWAAPFVDVWQHVASPRFGVAVPLVAVVHHDTTPLCFDTHADKGRLFLRALLHLSPPLRPHTLPAPIGILHALHKLSHGAFLTEHRFLTADFAVEEARYSNGVRVVINARATEDYETDDLHLPPLGFIASHPGTVAFYAFRIGTERFDGAAWHLRKSQEGTRQGESGGVREDRYPVSEILRREPMQTASPEGSI